MDDGTQALAACQKIFGPTAGLADGVDTTAAAGEMLVCTLAGLTSAEESWRLETVVLANVGASNVHYVEIDRGDTGTRATCDGLHPITADDDSLDDEESSSVAVLWQRLGEDQIIYRVDWMESHSSCENSRDWYTSKRSGIWVRNNVGMRQVAGCAWEIDPYDDAMVDCHISIAGEPGGVGITVEESSRARNPDVIPRQVVTTRHYVQRGDSYVLEKAETKTSEP